MSSSQDYLKSLSAKATKESIQGGTSSFRGRVNRYVEFYAPRQVRVVEEAWEPALGPKQIEIETVCSLISSGTELKASDNTTPNKTKKSQEF